jgi:hypothetical protein
MTAPADCINGFDGMLPLWSLKIKACVSEQHLALSPLPPGPMPLNGSRRAFELWDCADRIAQFSGRAAGIRAA